MRFGRTTAVDDVSLTIRPGESVALWGANGAGKTTILRCVTGLHRYRGRIEIGGIDAARDGKRARQAIGYVPQELGFNDDLRVSAAIELFATLRGVRVQSVEEILRRVQLHGHERKRMRELSGGMKQRLALAIALIGDPPALVLDEVTASLDAGGRAEFVALLASLTRNTERSVLFASHRVEEINALAHRVVMLERGRVIEDLPVRDFVNRMAESSMLHLSIEQPLRQRAIEVLLATGFGARLNGRGILVPVGLGQRMRPIHLLAENQITVHDFELTSAHGGGHS